jgi:hypothetical protein
LGATELCYSRKQYMYIDGYTLVTKAT